MKTKIYDLTKHLLTEYPDLRDSDKKLIWAVWKQLGFTANFWAPYFEGQAISEDNFMKAPSHESIRRSRQKIQELHQELRGSKFVQEKRAEKAEQKGFFVFHENFNDV